MHLVGQRAMRFTRTPSFFTLKMSYAPFIQRSAFQSIGTVRFDSKPPLTKLKSALGLMFIIDMQLVVLRAVRFVRTHPFVTFI